MERVTKKIISMSASILYPETQVAEHIVSQSRRPLGHQHRLFLCQSIIRFSLCQEMGSWRLTNELACQASLYALTTLIHTAPILHSKIHPHRTACSTVSRRVQSVAEPQELAEVSSVLSAAHCLVALVIA